MKRLFDLVAASLGLLLLSPVLLLVCLAVWLEDRHSPLYRGRRIGRAGRPFNMIKFRSMRPNADNTGVDSTAATDTRITRVGQVIRKLKLDEFSQLLNVAEGTMSLVGPRPQVERDVVQYTPVERGLLDVRPGITDFSSIVFADEGEVLRDASDPDLRYQQLIRPWKSRLGLHYVRVQSFWLDIRLILATFVSAVARDRALVWVGSMLRDTGAPGDVVEVSRRRAPLVPHPPPGADSMVWSRTLNSASERPS
jgi:lipopolysaccharide/colanic/teichoic acid biosynthesis glycosyltransferase